MDRSQSMIVRRYQKLLPADRLSIEEKQILKNAKGRFQVVLSDKDNMRGVFLYMLLLREKLFNIELLSMYDLIDIYLEKDKRYERLLDIKPDILMIYAGYDEFANKRIEEAFAQVSENLRVSRKALWLFYKGSYGNMKTRYPSLTSYIERRKYKVLELDKVIGGEEEL